MQHHANRALIHQSLWEQKLIAGFPFLDRIIRFFMMVGLYSVVSGIVVWGSIFIIWALVALGGEPPPVVPANYI